MDDQEVTVSTGVRFRLRAPSNHAVLVKQREMAKIEPQPPTTYIETKSREEENPNDPAYQLALRFHEAALSEALYDVVVCTGSEVIEKPDHMMGADSDEFAELLGALQISVGTSRMARYLQWVKIVATPDPKDWRLLWNPLVRLAGETEEDVAEAAASFPGNEERSTDNGTRSERRRKHRDKVRGPAAGAGG